MILRRPQRVVEGVRKIARCAYLTGYMAALEDAHNAPRGPLDPALANVGERRAETYADKIVQ